MFQASLRYVALARRYLGKGGFAIVYTLREVATGELFAAKASTPVAGCLLEARSPQRRRLLRPPAARWWESTAWRRSARARSCSPRFASTARCPTREPPALPPKHGQPPPLPRPEPNSSPLPFLMGAATSSASSAASRIPTTCTFCWSCASRAPCRTSPRRAALCRSRRRSPFLCTPCLCPPSRQGADSRHCLHVVPRIQRPAALPVRRR